MITIGDTAQLGELGIGAIFYRREHSEGIELGIKIGSELYYEDESKFQLVEKEGPRTLLNGHKI